MSSNTPRASAEIIASPDNWSRIAPRLIASILGIAVGTGMIVEFAIGNAQPILIIALALITGGYSLNMSVQRDRARVSQ